MVALSHFSAKHLRRDCHTYGGRCDRILWYGKGVRQISYFRSESKFSDHRPVSALFAIQIEVEKSNPIVAPLPTIFTSTAPSIQLQTVILLASPAF